MEIKRRKYGFVITRGTLEVYDKLLIWTDPA